MNYSVCLRTRTYYDLIDVYFFIFKQLNRIKFKISNSNTKHTCCTNIEAFSMCAKNGILNALNDSTLCQRNRQLSAIANQSQV